MLRKSPKKCWSLLVTLIYLLSFLPQSYAYQAIGLSDKELENLCVGGFDFNLNAAYAFRAAIVNQNNIAAVSSLNQANININASNKALVRNQGNFALAKQVNTSVIFSKVGDIANAVINNLNLADVGNIFTKEASPALNPVLASNTTPTAEPASLNQDLLDTPALLSAVTDVVSNASSSIASANIASTSDPTPSVEPASLAQDIVTATAASLAAVDMDLNATVAAAPDTTPSSSSSENTPAALETASLQQDHLTTPETSQATNNVAPVVGTANVAQTNIAAVIAPNGNIGNVKIHNLNIANVENQGNAARSAQTNIAVVLAGGIIENSDVVNSNIANVVNVNTADAGEADDVTPTSFTQVLGNNSANQILVQNNAQAAQLNITFFKSLGNTIKNTITQQLTQNKFISIR